MLVTMVIVTVLPEITTFVQVSEPFPLLVGMQFEGLPVQL
jgi:hypothetical protein